MRAKEQLLEGVAELSAQLRASGPFAALAAVLLVSCVVVVPCFWQPIVTPADLQSHLYNAWLANLVESGRLPVNELQLATQHTNVLIDWLLGWLLRHGSVTFAERAVCTGLILNFFWSSFCFLTVAHGRAPWWLCPWLAIFCYGLVFQYGFLNFFAGSGLVLWALAFCWRGLWWRLIVAFPLVALAGLAHPLPVIWFVCVAAYTRLARLQNSRRQTMLFAGCLLAVAALATCLMCGYSHQWSLLRQAPLVFGADQAFLYGSRYLLVSVSIMGLFAVLMLRAWRAGRPELFGVTAQVFGLTAIAIVLIPTAAGRAGLIGQRLSIYSGLLLLAALGRPTRTGLHASAGLASATLFFAFLYQDIGAAARLEQKIHELTLSLPLRPRIVSQLPHAIGSRVPLRHLLSRACLGVCFDYQNYEPSTGQFRLRAPNGSTIAAADVNVVHGIEAGLYARRDSDPELDLIYQCGAGVTNVCVRRMAVGERGLDSVPRALERQANAALPSPGSPPRHSPASP